MKQDDLDISYDSARLAPAWLAGGTMRHRSSIRYLLRLLRSWRPGHESPRRILLGWWRGNLYTVGERGPELFVPSGYGWVVPNDEVPHA